MMPACRNVSSGKPVGRAKSRGMTFDASEAFDARVFTPKIHFPVGGHAVAIDVILSGCQHAFAHFPVQVGIVVVHHPLSFLDGGRVGLYLQECFVQLGGILDVQAVNFPGDGFIGDDRFVEQQKFVYHGGGVADHHVGHEFVFRDVMVVDPNHVFFFCGESLVGLYPFRLRQRVKFQ